MSEKKLQIKRALIVQSPWAGLVVSGVKIWELRSRRTNIRERIGIIQAGTGTIIGEVNLTNCLEFDHLSALAVQKEKHLVEGYCLLRKWPVAWVLGNPVKYEAPVKYIHPPGAQTWVKLRGS